MFEIHDRVKPESLLKMLPMSTMPNNILKQMNLCIERSVKIHIIHYVKIFFEKKLQRECCSIMCRVGEKGHVDSVQL